ncbi:hypothetical protein SDC9_95768 [bioreactor metagenome]|uniref:Uncharacterized protein n=1 Tax=bioreactor metagenome TaxID=1076179 RepID=A0A645A791_9ZZZZ
MENSSKKSQLTPEQKHEQQFWLEIILPVALVLLLFIALIVLAITMTGENAGILSQWADVSIILLVLPILLFVLFSIALVILLNWVLGKWNKSLPPLLYLARTKVDEIASKLRTPIEMPAKPVIKIESIFAGIKQFFTTLINR